jgi:predicted nucleic acid-binding protein
VTIAINLTSDEEKKLLERAARSGQDATAYVHRLRPDPKDEPSLNLAIASGAAFLTTWDKTSSP